MSNLKMDNGDRKTYCYSWIVAMLSKKPEDVQRIIAAKLWYVMVISDHCGQVHRSLLTSVKTMTCLRYSPKNTTTTLMFGELRWSI
jgi:hypothetical protein